MNLIMASNAPLEKKLAQVEITYDGSYGTAS